MPEPKVSSRARICSLLFVVCCSLFASVSQDTAVDAQTSESGEQGLSQKPPEPDGPGKACPQNISESGQAELYWWEPREGTQKPLSVRFLNSEFQPIPSIDVEVDESGRGVRNVWIEVEAAPDDTTLDEGVIDEIPVHVTSDSNPTGITVLCPETSENSHLFRSKLPVAFCIGGNHVTP